MHMADALLSPAVGGTMWLVSAGAIACCSKKLRRESDELTTPLMGVLGAFLFAAQMINFTIPATGSSGHLGGGLLLTLLLGPCAAFLVISSVLVVQALFFADGGLLALGCNIFNMGLIPAFIIYPLIYRKLLGNEPTQLRRTGVIMISALAGLQLGPFCVVLECWFSGVSALPFATFLLLMQPIHLAIGIVEGMVTGAVVAFISQARPELLSTALDARPLGRYPLRTVFVTFLVAALFLGGIGSRFASRNPDGLEWAISGVTGKEGVKDPGKGLHALLASRQERLSFLRDYSFGTSSGPLTAAPKPEGELKGERPGVGIAGVVGTLLTLALVFGSGLLMKKRPRLSEDGFP
jgi:cobalt/nickel transport system permease protein